LTEKEETFLLIEQVCQVRVIRRMAGYERTTRNGFRAPDKCGEDTLHKSLVRENFFVSNS